LRALLAEGRRAARGSALAVELVDLTATVRRAADAVQQANPGVQLTLEAAQAGIEHLSIPVWGGEATLHRVLTNVLLNACQGDSRVRARHVRVRLEREESDGRIVIVIEDDGPGFPAAMLASPLRAFQTTKPNGTGLGLYTSDRLVRTSGGKLLLDNRRDARGACVRISFEGDQAW
jgi:C4-dicarboxylate-specific signal transduction histidine kinase